MKTRKLNILILAAFCLGLITLALPVVSFAQDDDDASFSRRYSRRDVGDIIMRLEQSSNTFRTDFNNYVNDRSVNSGERNRLTRIVDNYENALDNLRRNFDRDDNWWRSRRNVQSVMDEARQVNNMMNNLSFARRLERQWNQMRRDINRLAETYNLPTLDRNNGGGWDDGNQGGGNVPSWAIGTFYGRNPQTGGTITLDISRNGRVIVRFEDGATIYASMNGDRLNNGGIVSRVTRINNGIRTTRNDTGERIDYFTNRNGGGGWNNNDDGDYDNGNTNIPSWAIGTFYGRNPQTGGTITLDINRNGRVRITFEDGTTFNARMNGTTLNNGGITSTVTRLNNGIRTTRTDTGERIDYRR
jgi:hypothetical protein